MDLVLANRPGAAETVVRSLADEERDALLAYCTADAAAGEAVGLLERTWHSKLWFACSCRGDGGTRPFLYVRRTYLGRYVLAPMPERRSHAAACPFATPPVASAAQGIPGTSLPKLASLLFRWITGARLNVVYPYRTRDPAESQYASLKEAAKQIDVGRGRTLYDYSRTHAKGLPELFKRLAASGSEASGVVLSVIEAATFQEWRQSFHFQDAELTASTVDAWGAPVIDTFGRTACQSGPYVVLTEFARGSRTAPPIARAVLTYPVHSRRHLVPVDSAEERHTLGLLMDVQHAWMRKRQVVVCIRKTLPGSAVHDRGVSFQMQLMRANGLPERSWDVMTALAGGDVPKGAGEDALYHHVTGEHTVRRDQQFRAALAQRLEHAVWCRTPRMLQPGTAARVSDERCPDA